MKTPMQELIEQLKEERDGFLKLPPHSNIQERTENCFGSCIEIAERMLEKEKELIMDAHSAGYNDTLNYLSGPTQNPFPTAKDYYNKTFNKEER